MLVAIPLFPRFTALDAVGPYEVLQRIPSIDVVFVGHRRGEVRTDNGMLGVTCDATFDEVRAPDVVVVPAVSGPAGCCTTRSSAAGCGRCIPTPRSRPRCVPAPCYWPPRACSTASPQRLILGPPTCSTGWARATCPNALSSTCRNDSSPPRACPAALTWPYGWSSSSSIDRPRRPPSCSSNTTLSRHSTRVPSARRTRRR